MANNSEKSSLRRIPNVGSQTEQDLIAMGYTSIESLKGKKAEDLYEEECSRRVMDKCGFKFHHTEEGKLSPLGDVRTEHFTLLTKEEWEKTNH